MPFLDRRLERKIWRRPIPALAVAIVVSGMIFLGVKKPDGRPARARSRSNSHHQRGRGEDVQRNAVRALYEPTASQDQHGAAIAQIADPLVAKGKGIFNDRGCNACHGDDGTGTALAPSLVGVTRKLPQDRLVALLHNPNARMKAGGMPTVDASPDEMTALVAYLNALGKNAANSSAAFSSPSAVMDQGVRDEERAFAQSAVSPSPSYGRRLGVRVPSEGTIGRRLF